MARETGRPSGDEEKTGRRDPSASPQSKPWRRVVWILIAGAVVFVLARQVRSVLAERRYCDPRWHATASPEDLRDTAHQMLESWFADSHEAFVVLCKHGDASSIPYLRAALRWHPDPGPDGSEVCTWSHGREALRKCEAMAAAENAAK